MNILYTYLVILGKIINRMLVAMKMKTAQGNQILRELLVTPHCLATAQA